MWDLPGPWIKTVSPALAGGFLTTAPPGKSISIYLSVYIYIYLSLMWLFISLLWTFICWFLPQSLTLRAILLPLYPRTFVHSISHCVSLMISGGEHFLIYLLAVCMSNFEKCLFRSFAHFKIIYLFSCYWAVWVSYIFLYINSLLAIWIYFFPFHRLSLHTIDSFLCCAEL